MGLSNEAEALWARCADFHGHICGGLAIGFQAARAAALLLDLSFSEDEEVVCVVENDACGVDAITAVLGCSLGKGNLLLRLRGKQAFSFFNRRNGKSVRLVLGQTPEMPREEKRDYLLSCDPLTLFLQKPVDFSLPEQARLFSSFSCDCCGEMTAEPYLRLHEGKRVCIECSHPYTRLL